MAIVAHINYNLYVTDGIYYSFNIHFDNLFRYQLPIKKKSIITIQITSFSTSKYNLHKKQITYLIINNKFRPMINTI